MNIRKSYIFVTTILLVCLVPYTINSTEATTIIANDNEVKILLLLDHNFGANYFEIRTIFEDQFGWNVTTVALEKTVTHCVYHTTDLDVDVTIDNLIQLSSYDCLSIMPGSSHTDLIASTAAKSLINSAVSNGLVVSGWCKAVRVLAAADVIDGKNVTGNTEYESEYVAAGATFFEMSPPIIDGKLVTSVRSRFYRMDTCLAIAQVIGCFESTSPTHFSTEAIPTETGYTIKSNVTDESGVLSVEVKFTSIDENDQRILGGTTYIRDLWDGDQNGIFEEDIALETGRFVLDIIATDNYMNSITFIDVVILDPATKNNLWPLIIIALPFIMSVTIQRLRLKKK